LKNKSIAILVIILLASTTLYITTSTPTQAAVGQGDWITKYTIKNADNGQVILAQDFTSGNSAPSGSGSLLEGTNIEVSVTINIGVSNPSTNLNLATDLQKSGSLDYFWSHDTSDGYTLGSNYNPNAKTFSFPENAGTLTIVCHGVIPSGKVVQTVGDVTLHKPTPIALVILKDPSGTVLDQVKPSITDDKIDQYNTLLKEKQDKLASLQGSGASPSFVQAFQNTIDSSQEVAQEGFADNAIAMLNAFNVPDPASATLEILFIPLIAVFAVLAGVFGFMFMRSRGKIGYYKLVVEDQIKDLEGISLRASKIDRSMGASLESVKDRLKRLVGM
jgi:hypothetical protein